VTQSTGFEFIEGLAAELSSGKLVFPTSLQATMRIRRALMDPNSNTDKVAQVVGTEPVLSAQLLQMCNSAALQPAGKPVADVRTAVTRLGFNMVQNVAIAVGMKQLTQAKSNPAIQPMIEGLWKRSLRVAALAFVMAKRQSRLNPDTAMLAGLLHEIGKFYIISRARDYAQLFSDEATLWEVVDQWHAHIAGAILESWQVPEEIAVAVRDHRDFERTHTGPADLTDVVMAADFLDGMHQKKQVQQADWDHPPPAITYLGLDREMSETLIRETKHELDQIVQALS
jgi:putative nucleotidyltransferase with HDIG domain